MSEANVRVERDGGLAVLTLDRPDVLNAFDESLTSALSTAVAALARDSAVRAVVMTGAGRAFSAGVAGCGVRRRLAVVRTRARAGRDRGVRAVEGVER